MRRHQTVRMKHLGGRWKLQLSHFMKMERNGTQVEKIHGTSFFSFAHTILLTGEINNRIVNISSSTFSLLLCNSFTNPEHLYVCYIASEKEDVTGRIM
jgi:hypothetical protein